jgi:hypothetical protein
MIPHADKVPLVEGMSLALPDGLVACLSANANALNADSALIILSLILISPFLIKIYHVKK